MSAAPPRRTVMVGFGRTAAAFADDPVMARHYPYATHAQCLQDHDAFAWDAVIDPDPTAREAAQSRWGIKHVAARAEDLPDARSYTVAVLAIPPESRTALLDKLPGLHAVVVEKPLGIDYAQASSFASLCESRQLLVQVCLPRRVDRTMQELAQGKLRELIGQAQCAFVVYGNGLSNNGIHLVDWVRMLLGEVAAVRTDLGTGGFQEGPIEGDINPVFVLRTTQGVPVMAAPLRFHAYREVALDIWGEAGRLSLTQEGLLAIHYPLADHRALCDAKELASDRPTVQATTLGDSLLQIYDNLADALAGQAPLLSGLTEALATTRVIEAIKSSYAKGGVEISLTDESAHAGNP